MKSKPAVRSACSVLLKVAYDGRPFHGYAIQTNARSVAGELLAAVQKLDPSVDRLRGSSRTDAGVHARGQVVAFDCERGIPLRGWALGLCSHLPAEIAVRAVSYAPSGFDPRDHAVQKHYRYTLLLDSVRDPFYEGRAWRIGGHLDTSLVCSSSRCALGTHDFAAFRAAADERTSTVRTIHDIGFSQDQSDARIWYIDVIGNAFLHNMVRILVGAMVDIGKGSITPDAIRRALASQSRSDLGITAPAQGLCLESIDLSWSPLPEARWPEGAWRGCE